ncbi:MAG: cyanophycin synthetase [Thermoguttaceae bacterium]
MDFRKVLALRGPNIWANFPVLEAWVDLGELDDSASNEMPGFNERLMHWMPSMIEHRCSVGTRGGFFERLRRGTYLAHILEHVTLEIQSLAGVETGFGRARETSEKCVHQVVVECVEERVARECLNVGRELCLAAVYDRPFDVQAEVARLRRLAQEVCLGPSTRAICRAAKDRRIPVRRLNAGSLVQLGYGVRQRRILAAITDRTSGMAIEIAQDKEVTRGLLSSAGLRVAEGRSVASALDAWEAAQEIAAPVVVKPRDGNQGRGVATNLTTREQVTAAYEAARREGLAVVVEKHAPGDDFRLLVVGGKMVAAARRQPPQILGDGVRTIAELVAELNADPRRGEDHSTSLSKIPLDAVSLGVLAEQGMTPGSTPPAGVAVLIRRNANLSTGGTATDVTDDVHPDVAARAVEAARIVGLDIAGIDVIARDIRRPLEEQGGIICEVNAGPGLRMHLDPSAGTPRPVGKVILDTLFPPGETGRIPVIAVTGVNGKTTTTRLIAHIVEGTGRLVGMTCTDGIFIGNRRVDCGDCSGPASATAVLSHPSVEAAVLETARGGILRAGLGFDYCDVAVVTNIGEGDHLGLSNVETPEKLACVKRAIVDVVQPDGTAVLNAADPLVAGMAPKCPGAVLFFAIDGNHSVILRHRNSGGRVAFVRGNTVILAAGSREEFQLPLDQVPLAHGGRVPFQVENILAAVAAAWSIGVSPETICRRVQSFGTGMDGNPARFNLLEIKGATVLVDYGHNVSALGALIEALGLLSHARRTAVYTVAGDRRDSDILRQAEMLGGAFDRVILYEDQYLRGRPKGQIMSLLGKGLEGAARTRQIDEYFGMNEAIDAALATVCPGELLLIQADTVDGTVEHLRGYLQSIDGSAAQPTVDPFRKIAAEDELAEEDEAAVPALVTRVNRQPVHKEFSD